jgi:PIN domain nuclease of toxin-antitoxin system
VRLLLDTHTAMWWTHNSVRLSSRAISAIEDPSNVTLLSAVVVWEIAIKRAIAKLRISDRYREVLLAGGAEPLPIDFRHAQGVEHLPPHHRDPFDRLLISQALVEDATIVTSDPQIGRYDVPVLW